MAFKKRKRPFAWSISRLIEYELCPFKYKCTVDKVKDLDTSNKYIARGNAVHKDGEDYLKGKKRAVPKDYKLFERAMKELRKLAASAEGMYAFTRKWELTGWYDDPWLRVKMDVVVIPQEVTRDAALRIIDFKTGQPKEYPDQERLYKVAGLSAFTHVPRAFAEFWYLDHGIVLPAKPKVVKASTFLRGAQREFELRAARMEKETKFKPRPGAHCRFCDYSKRKGGPCRYGS